MMATEPKLKDKLVCFDLLPEMTFADLTSKGHSREEIDALFKTLQDFGFGSYILGSKGRGNSAKFIANEKCPKQFTIVFKVKYLHKEMLPCNIEKCIASDILSIPRVPKFMPFCIGTGYACAISQGYLFVDRYDGSGFKSIAGALDDIWEEVKNSIPSDIKDSPRMTKQQEVVSRLMGLGYLKLEIR